MTNLPAQNNQSLDTTSDVTFNSVSGDGSGLTGVPASNPFNQTLDTTSSVTFNSVSGDGSGLTGVPSSNHFDQSLNAADSPTFNALTVTSISGNGSALTNLPAQNNQSLDTTSDVTFNSVSGDGSGLTGVPASNPFNQTLDTTSSVTFNSVSGDGSGLTGVPSSNHFDQSLNAADSPTFNALSVTSISGNGSALTSLPAQNNQSLDTTDDVTFNSVSGDGSGLTGVPASNPFNQTLNTTSSVTFNSVSGDGSALTGLPAQNNQSLDTTSDVTFNSVSGDGSGLVNVPSSNHFDQSLDTTDSPTFATLTATEVVSDEITSTTRTNNFDLNGSNLFYFGSTAKYFQNSVAFRPATADQNIDLGIDTRRWKNVYSVSGDISGNLTAGNVLPASDASGTLGSTTLRYNSINAYNSSLKGTLTQEVGSLFKMYSVGDAAAANQSYLQFNPVAGDFYLGTKKTGTETAADLYIQHDGGTKASVNSTGLRLHNLPSSDPSIAGQLWNDGGTLKVSSGGGGGSPPP